VVKNKRNNWALTSGNKTSNTIRSGFNTLQFRRAIPEDLRRELKNVPKSATAA
jgi:hypothetical protein